MTVADITSRILALKDEIESISKDAQDDDAREHLFEVIAQARSKLENPVTAIWNMIFSPHALAALMVMIEMGVVKEVVQAQQPKTASELSTSCGGDEILIVRMMRPLVAKGIFRETAPQTYESTLLSETLVKPSLIGGYQFQWDLATRSVANLPRYLARTGYKNVNGHPGPFQDCHETDDGMFPYLVKHPKMMSHFNDFMTGSIATRPNWFDTFNAYDILFRGAKTDDPDSVLLIDIGGGKGHDIAAFHKAFPEAHNLGRLMLQDLPAVIDDIQTLDAAIVRKKHSFFGEQPVKGARAYYFRNVFHDWPDSDCVQIFKGELSH